MKHMSLHVLYIHVLHIDVYKCMVVMAVYCVWQVSKWYVVLNGQLKLIREREGDRILQVGDS